MEARDRRACTGPPDSAGSLADSPVWRNQFDRRLLYGLEEPKLRVKTRDRQWDGM